MSKLSTVKYYNLLNYVYLAPIILIGLCINTFAYLSIFPFFSCIIVYLITLLIIFLSGIKKNLFFKVYTNLFFIGFFVSGIAAIYANYLGDNGQLYSDASSFYELSSNLKETLSLKEIQLLHGGSLAIIVWNFFYFIFDFIGIPNERYIGIIINLNNIALSSIFILKSTIEIYGLDYKKINKLYLFLATCGLLWLFSSIHLRDSFGYLFVSILIYEWVLFLNRIISFYAIIRLILLNLLIGFILLFIREDFILIPVLMLISSFASFIFNTDFEIKKIYKNILFLVFILFTAIAISFYNESIIHILIEKKEGYSDLASIQQESNSLGMIYIVNQPFLIRLVFGSIYLFLFPIPFWSGFQLESAYSLFKSLNAIYFYFLTPIFLFSIFKLTKKRNQKRSLIFLFFVSLSFIFSIALTSLETRHFGALLTPIFLLCLIPDMSIRKNINKQKILTYTYIIFIFFIHFVWYSIKYIL
jgi:hypothetical protein